MLYFKELVVFSDPHKRSENQDRAFHLAFDGSPFPKASMLSSASQRTHSMPSSPSISDRQPRNFSSANH